MVSGSGVATPLPVRLFGPIMVGWPEAMLGPRDFGGVKPKQLLELLLLERGRAVSKDRLADGLWGEALPISASASLETYVSVLRRRIPNGRDLIATTRSGYQLVRDAVSVDLDEFDRLVRAAASEEAADRYLHLAAAVALGTEMVLADEPYAEWVLAARRMYAERHLQARVQLAESCLVLGRFGEAAEHAGAALVADALSERAARARMLAFHAVGDQPRALRIYAELRASLAGDLGVVPTAETTGLYGSIREGCPPAELLSCIPGRTPAIRFACNGDVRIAFQSFGSGPAEIVFVPPFLTNLAATWDEPVYADFLHRLGTLGRVTIFDKRGSGLSDPIVDWPDYDERCRDVAAVLDASGVERAVLFGVCDGGALSVQFAARYPDRVGGLVLFGVAARLLSCPDFPWGWTEQFHDIFLDSFEAAWATGAGLEHLNPSIAGDPRYRALFARLLRLGASPGVARRQREVDHDMDLRPLLPDIHAPTLVLARSEDPWVRVENSRYLAEHLRSARLEELPGADHEPWLGDTEPVFDILRSYVADVTMPRRGAPGARTISARSTGF